MFNRAEEPQNFPQISHKYRPPFRLGTTSFIYPAGWAENVARLAPHLDEVELLFFESQTLQSLPDRAEMQQLADLAARVGLSYTVHLPVDVDLCADDGAERRRAAAILKSIVADTAGLPVTSYTLHLPCPVYTSGSMAQVDRWRAYARRGLEALLTAGVDPNVLSIETLHYPFEWAFPLVEALDLRVCLDMGHLIIYGYDLAEALDRYLPLTTVIHLHGVAEDRDHLPLDRMDAGLLDGILERLRKQGYCGSLSLEVFGLAALERSLTCFKNAWEKIVKTP
ncbi:MAG: cobamide remodeling phosphodiesterase CbiR [Desulfosarcinaceae bacterium]